MISVREEAKAFRIWREGQSVGWDCSVKDLAEATGMWPGEVSRIVRERGWTVTEEKDSRTPRVPELVHYFSLRKSAQDRGKVCDTRAVVRDPYKALLNIIEETESDEHEIFTF